VTRYLGDDKEAYDNGTMQPFAQDSYIRAFGRLKEVANSRQVLSFIIKPVTDHNEIATHLLEATLVHLQISRGLPSKGGANAKAGAAMHGDQMDIDGGMGNGAYSRNANFAGLSVNAKKVYQFLEGANQSHEGVHLQQIAQGLRMELNQVQKGGEELLDKGLIYSTVDEDTWALLEIQ
jgi:replication factor A2